MYTEWGPSTGGQPAENKYTNFVVQHLKFILKVTGHCVKDNFEVEGESIPQNSLSQIRQKGDRFFLLIYNLYINQINFILSACLIYTLQK